MPIQTNDPGFFIALAFALVIAAFIAYRMRETQAQWNFISLWIQCRLSNAPIGLFEIIGMLLRKVDVRTVIYTSIRLKKAGLHIPASAIECHHHSGGDVAEVTTAILMAQRAKERLSWEAACAMDLAGKDVIAVVEDQLRKRGKHPDQNPTPVQIEVQAWTKD